MTQDVYNRFSASSLQVEEQEAVVLLTLDAYMEGGSEAFIWHVSLAHTLLDTAPYVACLSLASAAL